MEKTLVTLAQDTDRGERLLALANHHSRQDIRNPEVAAKCTQETLGTLREVDDNVLQLVGRRAIALVKEIAA